MADPLDAAQAGFTSYIDPTEAAARSLQWTGGSTGWQPAVTPEQATAQGLQYSGGPIPQPLPGEQQFGLFTPQGGGPVMVANPQNVSQFGLGSSASGPAAGQLSDYNAQSDRGTAYGSALQQIRQRRADIAAQVPSLNRRQQGGAIAQIHALNAQEQALQRSAAMDQHQLNFEANQRRMLAHESAIESHRQLSTDRETSIDEQGHAMLQGMGQLDAALRNGKIDKNAYDENLLQLGQQYPLALRHPEAARHFEFAITEADKQNAYNLRREATQAAKLGTKYGIDAQVDPDTGLPSVAHTQLAALQTPKGKTEALGMMNREMMQKYGIGTGVSSLFNPVEPHTSDDNGQTINLPFLDNKTGQVGKTKVPAPLFNQMKADFNDRYFSLIPAAAGAASSPPTQTDPVAQIPNVTSADDYKSLPPGSTFVSNGKRYQKPAE